VVCRLLIVIRLWRRANGFSLLQIHERIQVCLIENDHYFGSRKGIYGEDHQDYLDNLERFGYYAQTVMDLIHDGVLSADVIHCHDWQAALIPVYVRQSSLPEHHLPVLLSIHNLAFQGVFPREHYPVLRLPFELMSVNCFEFYNQVNLLKAGILNADRVLTVSPQYAHDITTPAYGCGLDEVLKAKQPPVVGITNGLDASVWNAQHDPYLDMGFDQTTVDDIKSQLKQDLQAAVNLEQIAEIPIYAFVGRIAHQKGFDLIIENLQAILDLGCQVIVLGVGDPTYIQALTELSAQRSSQLAAVFRFDERLAHLIYAGADFFLMPSRI
jgi:starch synthase